MDDYRDIPPALDVKLASRVLRCSERLIRRLIAEGELEHFKISRLVRIPRHAILDLLGGSSDPDQLPQAPTDSDPEGPVQ